jgi:hypothetical protein
MLQRSVQSNVPIRREDTGVLLEGPEGICLQRHQSRQALGPNSLAVDRG